MCPSSISTLRRVIAGLCGFWVAVWWVGGRRALAFGWEIEVIAAQCLILSAVLIPLCGIGLVGMPVRRRFFYGLAFALLGVAWGEVHCSIHEDRVVRIYSEHPPSRVVVKRWFPYQEMLMVYDPSLGRWDVPD